MAIHFGENLNKSLAYANGAMPTFGGWFVLILLSTLVTGGSVLMMAALFALLIGIVSYIDPTILAGMPSAEVDMFLAIFAGGGLIFTILGFLVMLIAGFFLYGFTLRVYRGDELNFKNLGSMFGQGIVYFVIIFIYVAPISIVTELVTFIPVLSTGYLYVVCMIIQLLLILICAFISINAVIRYAKEGRFGAAFQIGKICSIISNIGWLRYIGNLILLCIIILVAELVLMIIPIAGWILLIIATPFIMIAQAKFLANLYESGEDMQEYEEIAEAMEE